MNKWQIALVLAGATLSVAAPATQVRAQQAAQPPVTLNLKDAPIRDALEQLFQSAKVDFTIDPAVTGFVTLKITEQPFENALRLIMRSATLPLTYTKESNVYIVKPRTLDTSANPGAALPPPPDVNANSARAYQPLEQIALTYIDPMDLAGVLRIDSFIMYSMRTRAAGGMGGGMGGGMMGGMGGGMGGGMMGGMGGMGGGMGGGMMGAAWAAA